MLLQLPRHGSLRRALRNCTEAAALAERDGIAAISAYIGMVCAVTIAAIIEQSRSQIPFLEDGEDAGGVSRRAFIVAGKAGWGSSHVCQDA